MKQNSINPELQKLFIIFAMTMFIVQIAQMSIIAFMQYSNTQDGDMSLGWLFSLLIPVLVAGLAFASRTKRTPRLTMVFEILLAVFITFMTYATISSFYYMIAQSIMQPVYTPFLEPIFWGLSLLPIGYVVLRLRLAKKW